LQLHRDFCRCAEGIAFNAILFRVFRLELGVAVTLAETVLLSTVH
jgi:hypothetical protein